MAGSNDDITISQRQSCPSCQYIPTNEEQPELFQNCSECGAETCQNCRYECSECSAYLCPQHAVGSPGPYCPNCV